MLAHTVISVGGGGGNGHPLTVEQTTNERSFARPNASFFSLVVLAHLHLLLSEGCLFPILACPSLCRSCPLSFLALFCPVGPFYSLVFHCLLCPLTVLCAALLVTLLICSPLTEVIVTSKDWFRLREVGRAGVVNIFFSVNIKTLGSLSS